MTATIRELPWDSTFFGWRIGSVNATLLTLGELVRVLKSNDCDLLYVYDSSHDDAKKKLILTNGGLSMGSRVVMVAPVSDVCEPTHAKLASDMTEELLNLAYESGHLSRFKKDSVLSASFQNMYKVWLQKEFLDGKVFVWSKDDRPFGFASVTVDSIAHKGKIGLVAVDARMRKQGIGRQLMTAAMSWLSAQGVNECEVATQGENLPAIRLYESIGFSISEEADIYHIWRKK